MARLELKFLGGLAIALDGKSLPELKSQKGKALLCYLALSGKVERRPFLAALLWSDMPESRALMNLRKTLQRLRPLHPYLLIARETVAFNPDANHSVDVAEFETGTSASQNIPHLQKAVALYQGDFLDDFMLSAAPLFEEWVLAQRARLREAALAALQRLVVHFREKGELETAVVYTRQRLTIEPWHEETHRDLMHLLALSGQHSSALAQYEICRELLADELGVEPTVTTIQLYEQIKAGDLSSPFPRPSTLPHNLPPQMTTFVGREAELGQLQGMLARSEVRLITIVGTGGMGKTRLALALAERELFRQGGGYKTHPYRHGVYFASLARLETADLLLPAIAEAINFRFSDGDNQREQLLRYLTSKAMLLVLDNFEHLLASPLVLPNGGEAGGAVLVDEILRVAPHVKIVVTTRVRLNRQAEQLFPIGGMTYPPENGTTAVALDQYSAVRLFVQCARRVRPDFEVTAVNQPHLLKICQLLQGMPLGIVLAASWLESLSPRAISQEMQQDVDFLATDMADVPQRQRSLRAAFNYSWRLLSQREQDIFRQMAIFRGGFSRTAAQAITGATLRDLQALVNKSLLTLSPNRRYDVHELLRQFAAEKLSEDGEMETAVYDHHSTYYCTLLHQHTPNWHNAQQVDTLAKVTREADNIQLAWKWTLQHEKWQRANEAIDSWCWYLTWRGFHADAERLCHKICTQIEQWLARKQEDSTIADVLYAKAMVWSGRFVKDFHLANQRFQKSIKLIQQVVDNENRDQIEAFALFSWSRRLDDIDRPQSRSHLQRSLRLYQSSQTVWGMANVLGQLSYLDWCMGDYDSAQKRAQESLELHQKLGNQWAQINGLTNLAWIYQLSGQWVEAEGLRHQALNLCHQLGDHMFVALCTTNLAYTIIFQGRFDEGKQYAKKSLALGLEDGYLAYQGYTRLAIGTALLFAGQYSQAQQELTRSLIAVRAVNNSGVAASVHCKFGYLALVNQKVDEAQSAFEEGHHLYQMVQGDAFACWALHGLGLTAYYRNDLDLARQYFMELLTEGLRRRDYLHLILAVSGLALYFVKRGEIEWVVTVWAQAQCHPFVANSTWFEDVIGKVVVEATAVYAPHLIEAAEEDGRSQDIWQLGESLLATLQAE